MKSASVLLYVAVTALAAHQAQAWWCTGHMLVAGIAYRNLTGPVKDKVDSYVSYFGKEFTQSPDFVQSSCWADDIKKEELGAFSGWHFTNNPFVRNMVRGAIPESANGKDVVWALGEFDNTLGFRGSNAHMFPKALAIRMFIHFTGDLHQPLHTMSMYSDPQFPVPDGDRGGNFFQIKGVNQSELHMFWDSGAGLWEDSYDRPLSQGSYNSLDGIIGEITNAYPPSFFPDRLQSNSNFTQWAADTYNAGSDVVYHGIQPGGTLPKSYIQKAREVARQQVAIGGYRLAQYLNNVLG